LPTSVRHPSDIRQHPERHPPTSATSSDIRSDIRDIRFHFSRHPLSLRHFSDIRRNDTDVANFLTDVGNESQNFSDIRPTSATSVLVHCGEIRK
jgi:hypothetical protein